MKVIHGSRSEDLEETEFKTCPICGATCFVDMDTCFGCLHHFDDEPPSRVELQNAIDRMSSIDETDSLVAMTPTDQQRSPKGSSTRQEHADEQGIPSEQELTDQQSFPNNRWEGGSARDEEDTSLLSFDHTQDIPSLKKPIRPPATANEGDRVFPQNGNDLVSHHICADKEGRQFEIAISVKLL